MDGLMNGEPTAKKPDEAGAPASAAAGMKQRDRL